MARRLSPWQKHVKAVLSRGGTMKQAAKSFRKNAWPDDTPGHRKAAKKGWTTRKRKSAKRSAAAKKAWRARKKGGKKGKVAANPRKARRNAWPDNSRGHRKASTLAAKRKGLSLSKYMARLGRKGGKAVWKKRKAKGRKKGRRAKSVRANILTNYRRNPAGLSVFTESIKGVFTVETLKDGLQVTGGALATVALPNLLFQTKFAEKIPAVVKSGWGSYLVNLVSAGLVSGIAAYFGKDRLARNMLLGGVSGVMTRMVVEQLAPQVAKAGAVGARVASAVTMTGMGILTQDVEVAVEKAVEQELRRQGMSDYLVPGEVTSPMLADYLVPAEVTSPKLADYLVPAEVAPDAGMGIIVE